METLPEIDSGSLEVNRVAGRIEYEQVSFKYESGVSNVLENINLVIEPGDGGIWREK